MFPYQLIPKQRVRYFVECQSNAKDNRIYNMTYTEHSKITAMRTCTDIDEYITLVQKTNKTT